MTQQLAVVAPPRRGWFAAAGLVLLSLVPVLAGSMRLVELGGDPVVTSANARFVESPVPVVVHIVAATLFSVMGAFQFVPSLRRIRWHRSAGRVLLPAGFAVALSGLWMTAFYPKPPNDGLVTGSRWIVGLAMTTALVLAVAALVRRDYDRHGEWMTRAYAIALGAGTQVITLGGLALLTGSNDWLVRFIGHDLGWLINIVVAEWVIRRRRAAR